MEAEQQASQQAGLPSPDQERKKRKRSRWGAETEAGLKVLASAEIEPEQVHPPAATEQQQQLVQQQSADGAGAEAEGRKKRRSRWEPETQAQPGLLQSLQVALPPSIAALVDAHVDPKVMELQRQLNIVSVQHAAYRECCCSFSRLIGHI
jgi:hypothetical protein